LHVFDFQGPSRRQKGPKNSATSFFRETQESKKKSTGDATRAKRGTTMWATLMAMWWGLSWALCIALMQSWTPRTWFNLKPTIYIPQWQFRDGAAEKHETLIQRLRG
jgi:hypothetical protein